MNFVKITLITVKSFNIMISYYVNVYLYLGVKLFFSLPFGVSENINLNANVRRGIQKKYKLSDIFYKYK